MELYSSNKEYKLYHGNMLDMLEVIEPNTIDSVITDPPYGLTSITKRFGKEDSAECQYGKDGIYNWNTTTNENDEYKGQVVNGRFPANTILTYDETDFDEVCGGFPDTKSVKSARGGAANKGELCYSRFNDIEKYECGFNDSGSASRYFYCAKASKKDRDEGLDEFNQEKVNDGRNTPIDNAYQRGETLRKNTHPTVKPTELMQYLVRLVTPNNGIILDPFNGSGSTGKAVMYENKERNKNYKYIGIELTEEYLPISKARIEYVCNLQHETNPQINIFELLEKEGE